MKRFVKLLVVATMIIGLTGCIKYDVSMEINKDKSMNLKITYAINKEQIEDTMSGLGDSFSTDDSIDDSFDIEDTDDLLDFNLDDEVYYYNDTTEDESLESESILDSDSEEFDSELSDEDFTEMITEAEKRLGKRGYKISEYTEDGYQGFVAVLSIDNIDNVSVEKDLTVEMSEILEEDFNDKELFTVEKGFFKNTYTANYVYSVDESDSSSSALYGSMFDFNYSIKVPYDIKSDNANSHDGDLLNWKVSLDKDTNIQFSFDIPNTTNIIIVIVGALLLFIVLIILIIISSNKRKNRLDMTRENGLTHTSATNNEILNNLGNGTSV